MGFHDLASMLPFVVVIVLKRAGTMFSMDLLCCWSSIYSLHHSCFLVQSCLWPMHTRYMSLHVLEIYKLVLQNGSEYYI